MDDRNKKRTKAGAIDWQFLVDQDTFCRADDPVTINHISDLGRSTVDFVVWYDILLKRGVNVIFEAVADSYAELLAKHRKWVQDSRQRKAQDGIKKSKNKPGPKRKYSDKVILDAYNEVASGRTSLEDFPGLYFAVSTLHKRATKDLGLPWPPTEGASDG